MNCDFYSINGCSATISETKSSEVSLSDVAMTVILEKAVDFTLIIGRDKRRRETDREKKKQKE